MQKPKILFFVLVIILLASFSIQAADDVSEVIEAEIQELTADVLEEYDGVGISVYVDSEHLAEDISINEGYSDKEAEISLQSDNLFKIGALTKSFTGMAIFQLEEQGKVDLEAPVSQYLDFETEYFDQITVRQALNMSSGLRGYFVNNFEFLLSFLEAGPDHILQPEELIDESLGRTDELLFDPGSYWYYTNTDYILLGMIIEEVTGESYEDYIQENILDRYELDQTYVAQTREIPEEMARGYYDLGQDGVLDDWTNIGPSLFWSAGAIVSTPEDISDWISLLAKGPEIDNFNENILYKSQLMPDGQYYSAGLIFEPEKTIGHYGSLIGYNTNAWHRIDLDTTVTVFANFITGGDPTMEISDEIFSLLEKEIID